MNDDPSSTTSHDSSQTADSCDVTGLLESLIDADILDGLDAMDLHEVRELRDRFQAVEGGLSFARRMVQGRLDIALSEVERRAAADPERDVLHRLPDVLSRGFVQATVPRPVRDLELPDFTETISVEIDRIFGIRDLQDLAHVTDGSLTESIAGLNALEQQVSEQRHVVHRMIDDLQSEIIDRYRTGRASVDDLLNT